MRQLEELEVFDSLRLSVVAAAEVVADVVAEVLADVAADIAADIAGRTELEARVEIRQLKAQVEIRQPEELEVLLVAVCYWDSLES